MTGVTLLLSVVASVLVDFSRLPESGWRIARGGATNATMRQIWSDADGLHVAMDAASSSLASWDWGAIRPPSSVGGLTSNSVVQVTFRAGALINPGDMTLVVGDSNGCRVPASFIGGTTKGGVRTNRFRIDGSRAAGFDPKPPYSILSIDFAFLTERGEAVFKQIVAEENRTMKRATLVKDVIDFQSAGRAPGARPFRGCETVRVELPCPDGQEVVLQLRENSGHAGTALPLFAATVTNGTAVFTTALDPERSYLYRGVSRRDHSALIPKSVETFGRATAAESLSVQAETGNPLHIVRTNTAERARLVFCNHACRKMGWDVLISLESRMGGRIVIPSQMRLRPGERFVVSLPHPMPSMGVWYATCNVKADDGSTCVLKAQFAQIEFHEVTPALPYGKFRLGVSYHIGRYRGRERELTLDALVACGAKIARVGEYAMHNTSYAPGKFDWRSPDAVTEALSTRGIAINAICYANAEWTATAERRKDGSWLFAPVADGVVEDYMERLSARYGERVDYFELGNEWDLFSTNTMRVAEASRLTRAMAKAIKRGNPHARVISNGWALEDSRSPMVKQKGFQEKVMRDCQDALDAHPVHVHGPWRLFPSRMERFFDWRRRENVSIPWYANETALTSAHGEDEAAAEAVWKKIVWSWANGSTDFIWYNLRATGWDPNDPEQAYGLLSADLYPRDGYAAFSALTALLEGFAFDSGERNDDGFYAYWFSGVNKGERQRVLIVWNDVAESGLPITVLTDAVGAERVDLYGNRHLLEAGKDGGFSFRATSSPSALVLHKATWGRSVFSAEALKTAERKVVTCGGGSHESREPDIVIDKFAQVHEIYAANPEMVHRTWRGPKDLSARVWIELLSNALFLTVRVVDERVAQEDGVYVMLTEGTSTRERRLPFLGRHGNVSVYSGKIPCCVETVGFNLRIEDDDGEGLDGWMFVAEEPVRLRRPPGLRQPVSRRECGGR